MNCIIPGLNLKVIAKALQALAKIGDELFIEAKKEKLTLITLNLKKTVCVHYHLLDSFFSSYEVDESDFTEECQAATCKIQMKILLPLFKGAHLEKKIDFVKIEYERNGTLMIFKMKFKCDDILMTHKLRLMDTESLTIGIKPDDGNNNILSSSVFFNQLLTLFGNSDDEITLEVSKDKIVVRNYIVGGPVKSNFVRSQATLCPAEFSTFQISSETAINFALKPLRTAIQFADGFNLNVGINFQTGGKPLAIIMKNPTFEVNFLVASLNPYSDIHSSMATTSIPAKITQVNNNPDISIDDREAMLNENWTDCTMDEQAKDKPVNNAKKVKTKPKRISKDKNACKKFDLQDLPTVPARMEIEGENLDVIPASPESPRTKKAKLVFGRCFEPTFSETYLGEVLAPNSDSE